MSPSIWVELPEKAYKGKQNYEGGVLLSHIQKKWTVANEELEPQLRVIEWFGDFGGDNQDGISCSKGHDVK